MKPSQRDRNTVGHTSKVYSLSWGRPMACPVLSRSGRLDLTPQPLIGTANGIMPQLSGLFDIYTEVSV